MVPPPLLRRLVGVLTLLFGLITACPSTVAAQDRGVPRFGPLVEPDTVETGTYDLGRLWSFAAPPLDYFEKQYGLQADERGFRHAQLATVRLPDCSGALVSTNGLVMTAARCVQPFLPQMESDSLRASAFYAEDPSQERSLPGLYAERVVEIEDVTDRVEGNGDNARDRVQQQMQEEVASSYRVEVVPEAGGARFVAYTYRRFGDVRLAFVPDRWVTVLGALGEPLAYPQHAWDVAVLRIYDGGSALSTPEHFEVRRQGARPGDAVFAVAHPSGTRRAETYEQLAFRRDVQLPARQTTLSTWTSRLRQYVDTAAYAGMWVDRGAKARAALQQSRGRLQSLQNEYVMDRLQRRDQELQRASASDSLSDVSAGGLMEQIADIQAEKRRWAEQYRPLSSLVDSGFRSATLQRALLVYRAQAEGDVSPALQVDLESVSAQPPAIDGAALAAHVRDLREHFESDSAVMRTLDDLPSPASIRKQSVFSDAQLVRNHVQQNDIPNEDPALELVSAVYDQFSDVEKTWSALVEREDRLTDSLSRARHRATDLPVALPRSRSLRIADGRILGYPYNGTLAPAFTTFYGLYGRHYAVRTQAASDVPTRWKNPPGTFERSTPLTTVASTDLGGGAYGGPLLNTSLQLVGIVFDGNVQSAGGEYLFLPRRMRAVAVDVRGVLEGLSSIHGAERLVGEMTEGPASQ